jgi:hypothetical protein
VFLYVLSPSFVPARSLTATLSNTRLLWCLRKHALINFLVLSNRIFIEPPSLESCLSSHPSPFLIPLNLSIILGPSTRYTNCLVAVFNNRRISSNAQQSFSTRVSSRRTQLDSSAGNVSKLEGGLRVQVVQEHSLTRDFVGQDSLGGMDHERGIELNEYGTKH